MKEITIAQPHNRMQVNIRCIQRGEGKELVCMVCRVLSIHVLGRSTKGPYRTTSNEIDIRDLLSSPVIIERHFWRTIVRRGPSFGASGVSTYHRRMNSSNTTFCSIQSRLGLISIEMIHWITHILLEGTTRRQEKQICHGSVYAPSL